MGKLSTLPGRVLQSTLPGRVLWVTWSDETKITSTRGPTDTIAGDRISMVDQVGPCLVSPSCGTPIIDDDCG